MSFLRARLVASLALALLATPSLAQRSADLVLWHGTIHTMDPRWPTVQAIATRGDRILAVGSDESIAPFMGPSTQIIDLAGLTAVPGFIEGHGHFISIGEAKQTLDLMRVRDWDEVVALVAQAAKSAAPGAWILGRGWHQEKWSKPPAPAVEGFPTHDSVSQVSPENPVLLSHASGHACFANAKAMQLAGVDATTKDPEGGEILRDAGGAPIGVFRERAQALLSRVRDGEQVRRSPAQRRTDIERAVALAERDCLAKGVTSFQDAGSSFGTIDVLRDLAEQGRLGVRLWVMVREPNERLARGLSRYRLVGAANHYLTVRAIKVSIDGALGARGAWLLEPYADAPTSTGLATETVEILQETADLAAEHGWQLCVHAIGDRANREVLDVFERVFGAHPLLQDPRWRIEHAQHLARSDIPRFAALGVVASMQGIHCTSDAPFVVARLGEQRAAEGAYVWRSLLDSGASVINGTDAPFEDVNPIASFYASVTRRLADGSAFHPEQCMRRTEALASYTIEAARAAFEEDLKGSLTPGKLADIAVLSRDLLTVPAEELAGTKVVATLVGGKVVHRGE